MENNEFNAVENNESNENESQASIRSESRLLKKAIFLICVGVALFHIWFNTLGSLSDLRRNSLHMGLLGFLGFLIYPVWKKKAQKLALGIDLFLGSLLFVTTVYLILFEIEIYLSEILESFELFYSKIRNSFNSQ